MSIHTGTRLLQISLVVQTNFLQTATKPAKTRLPIFLCPPTVSTTRQVVSNPKDWLVFLPSNQRPEKYLQLGHNHFVPQPFHFIIRQ
jgi:hypothetical protein